MSTATMTDVIDIEQLAQLFGGAASPSSATMMPPSISAVLRL